MNDAHHLAMITALLGPPPRRFLDMSEGTSKHWEKDGKNSKSRIYPSHHPNGLQGNGRVLSPYHQSERYNLSPNLQQEAIGMIF